jgi:excisionase family DNA binding protein
MPDSLSAVRGVPDLPLSVPAWNKDPNVVTAASLLGISRSLVLKEIHSGALPSKRAGRRILVPVAGIRAYLEGDS